MPFLTEPDLEAEKLYRCLLKACNLKGLKIVERTPYQHVEWSLLGESATTKRVFPPRKRQQHSSKPLCANPRSPNQNLRNHSLCGHEIKILNTRTEDTSLVTEERCSQCIVICP
ncbi:hypothetical protein DKX38_024311 [Salix brachista]|uniref:Uncharacterized protein n=1 Tax=Salix brachista TaxID=2182728 RepID=A0A5N5JLX3_9ROSI|nr:hypothetical protein DKX38_024311 [Salix brachista]